MKALTLYQPWAMLVATGWKEIETRDWYTRYRGPLAIHASKRWTEEERDAAAEIVANFTRQIPRGPGEDDYLIECLKEHGLEARETLGCVVATCRLAYCVPAQFVESVARKFKEGPWEPKHGWAVERLMGNYAPGRWAWILRDVVALDPPAPARGYQKLWDWNP